MKMITSNNSAYDRKKIQRILESPIPYKNDEEILLAKKLAETLTEEQIELAAHGSYAYWLASISSEKPTNEERVRFALRESRRFLGSPTIEIAEKLLKETCQFRKVRAFSIAETLAFLRLPMALAALSFGILTRLFLLGIVSAVVTGSAHRHPSILFHAEGDGRI